jgi:hypothetical protein
MQVHVVRFSLRKLNEVEDKEQYPVELSNRFTVLEHFDAEVDINQLGKLLEKYVNFSERESKSLRIEEA